MIQTRPLGSFKAVIFDKDGTLINSIPFWARHIETLIATIATHFGPANRDENAHVRTQVLTAVGIVEGKLSHDALLAGATDVVLFQCINEVLKANMQAKDYGRHEILCDQNRFTLWARAVIERESAGNIQYAPLFPQAREVLGVLRQGNFKLGLATSDNKANTVAQLAHLELENFWDWLGCVDTMPRPKPDGAGLIEFCRYTGLAPGDVLMVGDTIMDEQFARSGGAGAFWAIAEHPEAERKYQNPDRVLRCLADILEE